MIFHPRLAKELYPSKQFKFLTPEEDSFWMGGGYPDGHNKDTLYSERKTSGVSPGM
jgi:hypothetical protein